MPVEDVEPEPLRLVYEEDGYPQELLSGGDRAKAVANGLIQPDTAVTVYRGGRAPVVMPAADVDELAQLLFPVEPAPAPTPKVLRAATPQPAVAPRPVPPPPPRPAPPKPAAVMPVQPPVTPPRTDAPQQSQAFLAGQVEEPALEPGGYRPDRRPVLVIFALIAVALVAALALTARPPAANPAAETRVALKQTNVRAAPDVGSEVVGRLRPGDAVTGRPADGEAAADWFHVTAGPLQDRYVWMRNLGAPQDASTMQAPPGDTATPPSPTPSPSPTSTPCAGTSCRTLTAAGWGDVRAGMTLAEFASTGLSLTPLETEGEAPTEDPEACIIRGVTGAPGNLSVFVEHGVITSVGVSSSQGGPRFTTERGVGLGDSEAAVRRAYGKLEREADIYGGPSDKKLFYRPGRGRGIKFSIVGGKVVAMDAGGNSINYVEGCL